MIIRPYRKIKIHKSFIDAPFGYFVKRYWYIKHIIDIDDKIIIYRWFNLVIRIRK